MKLNRGARDSKKHKIKVLPEDHPDYPVDHDEEDRRAAESERLDNLRNEK